MDLCSTFVALFRGLCPAPFPMTNARLITIICLCHSSPHRFCFGCLSFRFLVSNIFLLKKNRNNLKRTLIKIRKKKPVILLDYVLFTSINMHTTRIKTVQNSLKYFFTGHFRFAVAGSLVPCCDPFWNSRVGVGPWCRAGLRIWLRARDMWLGSHECRLAQGHAQGHSSSATEYSVQT